MVKKLVAMAFAAALAFNVNATTVEKNEASIKEVEKEVAARIVQLEEEGLTKEQVAEVISEELSKDLPTMSQKKKKIFLAALVGLAVVGGGYAVYKCWPAQPKKGSCNSGTCKKNHNNNVNEDLNNDTINKE